MRYLKCCFQYLQTEAEKLLQDRLTKLVAILGGETSIDLHLQFLIRNNKTDMLILKNTKVSQKIIVNK